MSAIPVSLTEKQFDERIRPYISTAKPRSESKIPLFKIFNYVLYRLHTGRQWYQLPIAAHPSNPDKKEISHDAVYYHFRKYPKGMIWSRDGSLRRVWKHSIMTIAPALNLSEIDLDGSHVIAKKGGEAVACQGRKKAKTTNILPITDATGFIVASTGLIAGNHKNAYHLKPHLQKAFKSLNPLGLEVSGAYCNADKAFDTNAARKTCFKHGLIPNIDENKRNRKTAKRGRKRFFNQEVYKRRFTSERSFAWIDQFRALLLRFDRCQTYFLGAHFIAFAMINLRHLLQI